MQDLEIAKKRLHEQVLTLSIVKNGEAIFETRSHGIAGFLKAIAQLRIELEATSVADRVVGKAVALLFVYAKVKAVYGLALSQKAKTLLERGGIETESDCLVESILSKEKTEACLFERLASEIEKPEEAYRKLKTLQDSLNKQEEEPAKSEHEQFISEENEELKRIRQKKLDELKGKIRDERRTCPRY